MPKTTLRRYREDDLNALLALFHETVHAVAARDYTPAQLEAWAPLAMDEERWARSLAINYCVVAEQAGVIVGFGDMAAGGYFDRLYVHRDHQGQGIATAIAQALEGWAGARGIDVIHTDASITARPFFERRGYRVVAEQRVERRGQMLTNYRMEKPLSTKTDANDTEE